MNCLVHQNWVYDKRAADHILAEQDTHHEDVVAVVIPLDILSVLVVVVVVRVLVLGCSSVPGCCRGRPPVTLGSTALRLFRRHWMGAISTRPGYSRLIFLR